MSNLQSQIRSGEDRKAEKDKLIKRLEYGACAHKLPPTLTAEIDCTAERGPTNSSHEAKLEAQLKAAREELRHKGLELAQAHQATVSCEVTFCRDLY